ncbi:MAG: hypothetical protein J6Q51_01335 [Clostridia bacterium]|nr:hypothetical protein [Clostridia bacterium]
MKEFAFIDLHIHTEHSHEDGCDITVEQLLDTLQAMAEKKGGDVCFSITDHENMLGCLQADELLKKYPEKYNRLKFIPGMELNTSLKSLGLNDEGFATFRKCHLLGYGYDVHDPQLRAFSILMNKEIKNDEGKKVNIGRQLVYLKKLAETKYNIQIPYSEIEPCLETKEFDKIRKAFIEYLCSKTGKTVTEIIQFVDENLINKYNQDAQVKSKQDILELIGLIKAAGGKVSIAHPRSVRYKKNVNDLKNGREKTFIAFITALQKVTNNGIDGLEIFHSENTDRQFFKMVYQYAKKYNMFLTCGSDYHGGKLHSSKVLSKCLNHTFEFCSLNKAQRAKYGKTVYNTVNGLPFVEYMLEGKYEGCKQDFIFKNIEKGTLSYEEILKVMSFIPKIDKRAYNEYIDKYTDARTEFNLNKPKTQKPQNVSGAQKPQSKASNSQKYAPLPTGKKPQKQKTNKKKKKKKFDKKKHIQNLKIQEMEQDIKQVKQQPVGVKKDTIKE